METTVFDVVHIFSGLGISAVPIVDADGIVVNLYETVDVIVSSPSFSIAGQEIKIRYQTLVRLGVYQNLDLTIASALKQRAHDFAGVITCTPQDTLASLLMLIRQRRVHRLVVVEGEAGRKGRLVGIITLSDILRYVIGAQQIPMNGTRSVATSSAATSSSHLEVPGMEGVGS